MEPVRLVPSAGPGAPPCAAGVRFDGLDALRGLAAVLIVLYHIQGILVGFRPGETLLAHAYLAVDFFFLLSGFVLAHAYDARLQRGGAADFAVRRLVRLHPLVVLGMGLGLAAYLADPLAPAAQAATPPGYALAAFAAHLVLVPALPLAGRDDLLFGLNSPAWSLLQEYLGSALYALVLCRLGARSLAALVAATALILAASVVATGHADMGAGSGAFAFGTVRLLAAFGGGLLLYRLRPRLPAPRVGFAVLAATFAAVLAGPSLRGWGGAAANGLYDAAAITAVFPVLVLAGSHQRSGAGGPLGALGGRLSYPLYITHMPIVCLWHSWYRAAQPGVEAAAVLAAAVFALTLMAAWLADRWWDRPLRALLTRRLAGLAQPRPAAAS